MSLLRRLLGILVMLAGILGLVLSLAGLVGVWRAKPGVAVAINTTITMLNTNIDTSQKVMKITGEALGATVDSVDTLSTMLSTTAVSVEDTQPVLDQLNAFMGEQLPTTIESAAESLKTAQQAAEVLDSTIQSLDAFRTLLSNVPLINNFVQQPAQPYNPDVPLSDSLGEVAANLEDLPEMFTDMAANLDKADDNLVSIQTNLTTMSSSVGRISISLGQYEAMVAQSQSSMENLKATLMQIQSNLDTILNWVAGVLSLFLFWLLVTQVVIFTQGWELYQGTAGRMEGGEAEPPVEEPA